MTNISRRMDPVIQFDWARILKEAWIPDDTPMAYILGDADVPYDALPLKASDAERQARLGLRIVVQTDGCREIVLTNDGQGTALDVRVFLHYKRTVIDVPELTAGDTAMSYIPPQHPLRAYGQAVLEFSDEHDFIYRQYADLDLDQGRVRKLSPTAFRVNGRIVEPKLQGVS